MNIGIVTTWFERGASYVSKQYKELLDDDFNVYIYARGGEKYAKNDPNWDLENVTWGKRLPLSVPMAIDKDDFIKWIRTNHIGMILFNEQQWWPPIQWCREEGVICGSYVDYYTKETVPLFAAYDFLLCNTKRHLSVFKWHQQPYYIPWGTNIDLYKPSSHEPVQPDTTTFFHSCGMNPDRKGTAYVLEAYDAILGDAQLILHSQIDLCKALPDKRDLILKLLDQKKILIIEKTVHAPGLYNKGDVYVYPSKLDGIGLTIAEALSCGLPVIVPDNGPMNEFVDSTSGKNVKIRDYHQREDGYFWPECQVSIKSLTKQMQWYVDNKDRLPLLKKSARKYAEKKLNWSRNKKDVVKIFKNAKKINNLNTKKMISTHEKIHLNKISYKIYTRYPIIFNFLKHVYQQVIKTR